MKKLICLFVGVLLMLPVASQNYIQQGDELFEQAQYEKAIKKYNAAIEVSGSSSSIKTKIRIAKQCLPILNQAQQAEQDKDWSKAITLYNRLYDLHQLSLYKSKVSFCQNKINQTRVLSYNERMSIIQRINNKFRRDDANIVIWEGQKEDGSFYSFAPVIACEYYYEMDETGNFMPNSSYHIYMDVSVGLGGSVILYLATRHQTIESTKEVLADRSVWGNITFNQNSFANDEIGAYKYIYAQLPSSSSDEQIIAKMNELLDKMRQWRNNHIIRPMPKIVDIQVADVTRYGYTVSCRLSVDYQVDRVQFPTWTRNEGQDDLNPDWWFLKDFSGVKLNDRYYYRVNAFEHNGECGMYATHIYVYGKEGQWTAVAVGDIRVPCEFNYYNGKIVAEGRQNGRQPLSSVETYKDGGWYKPRETTRIRCIYLDFSKMDYYTDQYCFIVIKSRSNPNYEKWLSIAGDQYGLGNFYALKGNCIYLGNNIYAYYFSDVDDAYIDGWQFNFPVDAVKFE